MPLYYPSTTLFTDTMYWPRDCYPQILFDSSSKRGSWSICILVHLVNVAVEFGADWDDGSYKKFRNKNALHLAPSYPIARRTQHPHQSRRGCLHRPDSAQSLIRLVSAEARGFFLFRKLFRAPSEPFCGLHQFALYTNLLSTPLQSVILDPDFLLCMSHSFHLDG